MTKAVFGLADNSDHADRIVASLQQAGFGNSEISILLADKNKGTNGIVGEHPDHTTSTLAHEKNTKAPEGGVTGATAGGLIGGSLGLLAGIGALAIPGLGPFIAAGPILATLSGSAVGGALGLVIGSLVGMGIPEYEAKKYESHLKTGGVLLAVHCMDNDHINRAKAVLEKQGAKDIATSTEKAGSR